MFSLVRVTPGGERCCIIVNAAVTGRPRSELWSLVALRHWGWGVGNTAGKADKVAVLSNRSPADLHVQAGSLKSSRCLQSQCQQLHPWPFSTSALCYPLRCGKCEAAVAFVFLFSLSLDGLNTCKQVRIIMPLLVNVEEGPSSCVTGCIWDLIRRRLLEFVLFPSRNVLGIGPWFGNKIQFSSCTLFLQA